MTTREFINNQFGNADGSTKWCSSVYKDGKGNIYSYGPHYPLLFQVAGRTFRNVRGYSNTTAKHINWAGGFNSIDIKLDRDASSVIANNWASDDQKVAAIKTCLIQQRDQLQDQLNSKKRTDTQVYKHLQFELNTVINNLNRLEFTPAEDDTGLGLIAGVMALGDIFGSDQKESNDWKTRMLKAGLENRGLIMPDDWDTLDEATKERRLNAVIETLK